MGLAWVRGAAMGLVMAGFCGGCRNPIDAFGECDFSGGPVDKATSPIDVDAVAKSFSGDYLGTLTWSRTGTTTPLAVSVAQLERQPPTENRDCSNNLEGYDIRMKVSVSSGDMLVMPSDLAVTLRVDTAGAFEWKDASRFEGDVDFEALKAAGITPPEWGSNFFPAIRIPYGDRDLTPHDGAVSAEGTEKEDVVLGTVTFP